MPQLLIVGPQKTGTTALQAFLKLNPSIETSKLSHEDFEEVQFFNKKHYFKGVDWYLERFSHNDNINGNESRIFLDKSATYFDDPEVPRRAGAMLPNAHILILLINPADRAYSWYQHIRAHGNPIANKWSFYDVINFDDLASESEMASLWESSTVQVIADESLIEKESTFASSSQRPSSGEIVGLKALRSRCLHPGYYSNHLLRWLEYYQSRQVVVIDGEWFKLNPAAVLDRLQSLLRLPRKVDYSKLLVYSKLKGHFCVQATSNNFGRHSSETYMDNTDYNGTNQNNDLKCLGSGKGRKYPPMSTRERAYLNSHYLNHNIQLARLLYEIGQPLPNWLDQAINPLPTGRVL